MTIQLLNCTIFKVLVFRKSLHCGSIFMMLYIRTPAQDAPLVVPCQMLPCNSYHTYGITMFQSRPTNFASN